MPEWRKIFEAEDSDFGGGGLGAMEACSSTEMGAQAPRIWERETTDPRPTEAHHDQNLQRVLQQLTCINPRA
jgi:hypothetical protein